MNITLNNFLQIYNEFTASMIVMKWWLTNIILIIVNDDFLIGFAK